jgi:hypothetical protein
MTDEQIALAKRAVACKGWRWMPGMLTTEGMRVIHDPHLWPDRPCAIREGTWVDTAVPRPLGDHLPDLTDPATLGCLLALVREAWDQEDMGAVRIFRDGLRKWCVEHDEDDALVGAFYGPTEAEALVAALEAA